MVWFQRSNWLTSGGASAWNTSTATTSTTASTIMYVTVTQTGTASTMGLYNSPTWTDQWTTPTWSLQQDRQWLSQQRQAADAQNLQMQLAMQRHTRMHEMQREMLRDVVPPIAAPAISTGRIRREEAAVRARELLLSYLSDDQIRTFVEHGWFIVLGGRSGRRYRISGASYAGNVALLCADNDNHVEATFCGHCDPSIPLGDQLLAQKIMLEIDEPAYIQLANRTQRMHRVAA